MLPSAFEEELEKIFAPHLKSFGVNIVCVKVNKSHNLSIEVLVERDDRPVSIDECARASRNVKRLLEVENSFLGKDYTLEVGSAGIDRPFSKEEDFVKFSGKKAKINTYYSVNMQNIPTKKVIGIIKSYADKKLIVTDETNQDVAIEFHNIKSGNLIGEVSLNGLDKEITQEELGEDGFEKRDFSPRGDRRPFEEKRSFGKKTFERSDSKNTSERSSFRSRRSEGQARTFEDRRDGENRSRDGGFEKRNYPKRREGAFEGRERGFERKDGKSSERRENRSFGDKKPFGGKHSNRPFGGGGGRSFGNKPYGRKPSERFSERSGGENTKQERFEEGGERRQQRNFDERRPRGDFKEGVQERKSFGGGGGFRGKPGRKPFGKSSGRPSGTPSGKPFRSGGKKNFNNKENLE
jgi:ribosome maturation factor RimP